MSEVIEMTLPQSKPHKKRINKWMYSIAALAACMILIMASVLQQGQGAYASVYMTINPQVRIDVNHRDIVVGLQGVNDDGKELLEGYSFNKEKTVSGYG